MSHCWVGVASLEHVLLAVAGGFCQLNHGKEAPLKRLRPGDKLVYYSPKERMRDGVQIQSFTAIGEILVAPIRQELVSAVFTPFRRDVSYFDATSAPIRPLLSRLAFTRDSKSWGQKFMRGAFQIDASDFQIIAESMGASIYMGGVPNI